MFDNAEKSDLVEMLHNIKRSKYEENEISDELDEILYIEALREAMCCGTYNGGRRQ